ncbi:hypothetical protein BDP27DRAFT_1384845 [Rhodocollybia butyracea]|uniref:Uncharacterized protein n=1 Tax=Rhodocollybia butyracea TaxID=206335 RepID=A0A9P5U2Y9_9AGAR|nr:hypothetical protein BDP27DRAFT_1384845 [Rhodocollybia butyracea]
MEDRELQVLVRRAKTNPDKTGTSRRSALKQLVEATHSSSVPTKLFAASNIPEFFQDFPESEEDAINAVYDLCEDQSAQARYRTLASISKLEKKWVKRNADVLVQLLQSDEPNEVGVVRKALVEHLHLDPRVTLGVLCDQIILSNEPADQEELAMRDNLRTLVLTFITGELKKGQLVKYMPSGSDAEDTLIDGLISALPNLADSDVQVILNDILLHLQFLDTPSPRGSKLSKSVLQRARAALSDDHQAAGSRTRPLTKTRPYLGPLSTLFISKSQENPEDLLHFYTPLTAKSVFPSIPTQDQLLVLYHFAETLYACKSNTPNVKRVLGLTPFLFECLSATNLAEDQPQETCILMLRRLLAVNAWFCGRLAVLIGQSGSR